MSLKTILLRLLEENLRGPVSPWNTPPGTLRRDSKSEFGDLDSKDPRWFELFMEYFIKDVSVHHDDLLFFVRQKSQYNLPSEEQFISKPDPIIVKRRIKGQIPQLEDLVCWKQTFFLNVIVQTPLLLTVSICEKKTDGNNNDNSLQELKKSEMKAIKRIIKKVYASPYKNRLDVLHDKIEVSYPNIYYCIDDFEREDLIVTIENPQYLCVELALIIPKGNYQEEFEIIESYISKLNSELAIEDNGAAFPVCRDYDKVVLFQGAVAYSSLNDVYSQKSKPNVSQSFIKNLENLFNRRNSESDSNTKKDYILMRGPNGKGQCQVAVMDENVSPVGLKSKSSSSLTDRLKSLYQPDSKEISSKIEEITKPNENIETNEQKLKCSLTFVNVNWKSIVSDIIGYSNKYLRPNSK